MILVPSIMIFLLSLWLSKMTQKGNVETLDWALVHYDLVWILDLSRVVTSSFIVPSQKKSALSEVEHLRKSLSLSLT